MKEITTKQAVDTLISALVTDQSLYCAYQANIAMAFQDEAVNAGLSLDSKQMHTLSNNGAIRFLNQLCNDYRTWEQREADKAAHKPIPPVDEFRIGLKQEIGITFMEFANKFFGPECPENMNGYVQFHYAFQSYRLLHDPNSTAQSFESKLRKWCIYKGFIYNPSNLRGYSDTQSRIILRARPLSYNAQEMGWSYEEQERVIEFIYIRTFGTELTTKGLGPEETTNG